MGFLPNLRKSNQESAASTSSSSTNFNNDPKKKSINLMPLCVALVVIAEIAFLGRLDVASWTQSLDFSFISGEAFDREADPGLVDLSIGGGDQIQVGRESSEASYCEEWLERADAVVYSRDFKRRPVFVAGGEQEWKSCSVGCKFGFDSDKTPDAAFGLHKGGGVASVIRSMESSQYYAENKIANARRKGYDIIMTTSLSSDVPVGYFSWAEYDIMAPVPTKNESALAAAFISNCGARNFRLQALEGLEKANIKIDSYGGCHRNRDGRVDKVEALKRYRFSLAFENSNEEDYVTEKFFQSLVAGCIPVVVGAPNIEDFAPSPGSILHIKELSDINSVAKTMKYLAENATAFNQSLRWKYEGPSDSFKALVDMAAVHSSCRLCIHVATLIREKEEKNPEFKKRPCRCSRGSVTVHHVFVRERGGFETESVFLRSGEITLKALESAVLAKFTLSKHVPIWKKERPESIRGGDELKIYRIYPVGMTQRQALYTFRFKQDADLRTHIESNPCPKFEVIFV